PALMWLCSFRSDSLDDLQSFPTRRSSDLENHLERLARAQAAAIALYYNLSAPEEEKKSGWYQEEGGWRYYLGNTGEPVRNDWHRSEEHTSELQSRFDLVCRLLLEKKKTHK